MFQRGSQGDTALGPPKCTCGDRKILQKNRKITLWLLLQMPVSFSESRSHHPSTEKSIATWRLGSISLGSELGFCHACRPAQLLGSRRVGDMNDLATCAAVFLSEEVLGFCEEEMFWNKWRISHPHSGLLPGKVLAGTVHLPDLDTNTFIRPSPT